MNYKRDISNVFYDVTNYYFHTEEETNLIAKGYSKERKEKFIVQMGLLMDKNGLPITYELFRGNTTDSVSYEHSKKFDGYYSIATSELDMADEKIIEA